jgi:hypothetical protein
MPTDRRADIGSFGPAVWVVLPALAASVRGHVEQAQGPVGRLVVPARPGIAAQYHVAGDFLPTALGQHGERDAAGGLEIDGVLQVPQDEGAALALA